MGAMLKKRSEIEEKYKWNLEDMIPSEEALESLLKKAEVQRNSVTYLRSHSSNL